MCISASWYRIFQITQVFIKLGYLFLKGKNIWISMICGKTLPPGVKVVLFVQGVVHQLKLE